jgi:hypothetical protein
VCGVGPVRTGEGRFAGEVAGVRRVLSDVFIGSSTREREDRRNCRRAEGWKQKAGVRCVIGGVGSGMVSCGRAGRRDVRGGEAEGGGAGVDVEVAQNQASLSVIMYYYWCIRLILDVLRCVSISAPTSAPSACFRVCVYAVCSTVSSDRPAAVLLQCLHLSRIAVRCCRMKTECAGDSDLEHL